MKKLYAALAAMVILFVATNALALRPCEIKPYRLAATRDAANVKDCTIGYAIDDDTFKYRANSAWVAISTGTSLTGAESGTLANSVAHMWDLTENSETLRFNFTSSTDLVLSSSTGITDLTTAFILNLTAGAGVLTFSDSGASFILADNDTTALLIGSTGHLNLLTLDTGNNTETVIVTGETAVSAFHVDVGLALFDELVTIGGNAGALTFTGTTASVLVKDNTAAALSIGSAGATDALVLDSQNGVENFTFGVGVVVGTTTITGVITLDESDCGKIHFVTAGADDDIITLPSTLAGCVLTFVYTGADAGCQLEITPTASDKIQGNCTLAASIVTFSGADNGDVELDKSNSLTGDNITLVGDGVDGWFVKDCSGIWEDGA